MATTFLPPIFPSPFGKAFTHEPYVYPDISHNGSGGVDSCDYEYGNSSPQTVRAISGRISPVASRSPADADENAGRYFHRGNASRSPPIEGAYPHNAGLQGPQVNAHGFARPTRKASEQTEKFPVVEDPWLLIEHGFEDFQCGKEGDPLSDQSCSGALNDTTQSPGANTDVHSSTATGRLASVNHGGTECTTLPTPVPDRSLGKTAENFRRWASTFRHRRNEHRQKVKPGATETELREDATSALSTLPLPHSWPRKRTSNASSRFVATVQTASLSNDSISVLPRSHRFSRISDTRANRSSDPRSSVDSQRPSSISSSDEGALRRGLRRRQILQEVLSSEESYVCDLKALHNLFSTLLTSIPAISPQTRNSIQRNVTEMLHLHEQIVDELHQVALRATLRQWHQISSCQGRHTRRQWKWQSLDAASFHTSTPKRSHTGVSLDVGEVGDVRSRGMLSHAADPAEVVDVAQLFKHHMARFFVYEEYCAKYEIMVQEVVNSHKMVPQWSAYEVGMEALANSLTSLDQRGNDIRKGLTAADLLIKPVQRICKYPLLFLDLHKNTPVVDCPSSHAEVDGILSQFRSMVREINLATDDPRVRERSQRRWLLQDRLKFSKDTLGASQFRMLGHVLLCGVLHVAYQTNDHVEGGYMLCMMFKDYLLLAVPAAGYAMFDIVVTIYLSDAKVVSSQDGKGLQCHNALFSWKVMFQSENDVFELLFSACSAAEQQQWMAGMERGRSLLALEGLASQPSVPNLLTTTSLELKALAPVFGEAGTLARRLSIQRAATVGTRVAPCQVIIRNTHKPQDSQEMKVPSAAAATINRSQSLLTTHRVAVLAPKRSERVRLEQSLADVWTRDTLPFPGMTVSRGGNIIRASAGSLARKLSLASIHTPFAKRSASLTLVGSRFSHDLSSELKHEIEQQPQRGELPLGCEIILDDHDERAEAEAEAEGEHDGQTMSKEINISPPPPARRKSATSTIGKIRRGGTMKKGRRPRRPTSKAGTQPLPQIPPDVKITEGKFTSRKRWNNPLGLLKNISLEGLRHLLYPSK